MNGASLLSSFFDTNLEASELPPYFTLGARPTGVATASIDSSDQSVITLDNVTGVAACRSGVNIVAPSQEVIYRSIGDLILAWSCPTAPPSKQLRNKLSIEQAMRLSTGRRPFYSSLRSPPPMIHPRLVAAGLRVVEDYRRLQLFANSVYAVPGMLFMVDGRLNAQNFPGASAIDLQARLFRARGLRLVSLTKDGLLMDAVRREARAIRSRVGVRPFAFPVLRRHLELAYRGTGQRSAAPKTIRHGSSSSALGGTGAVRFALSISGEHLTVVEMNLYDFEAFSGLVRTGERLESHICRRRNLNTADLRAYPPIYSWDVLPFVSDEDWERHIVPTLEEIVWSAYTDTELGIYPRALADAHNHVKIRFSDPEVELLRRHIIFELARDGVSIESIPIFPEGPHKTDPDEFDSLTG